MESFAGSSLISSMFLFQAVCNKIINEPRAEEEQCLYQSNFKKKKLLFVNSPVLCSFFLGGGIKIYLSVDKHVPAGLRLPCAVAMVASGQWHMASFL
jgi:hypothetical protein